jgi:hypothetical protein
MTEKFVLTGPGSESFSILSSSVRIAFRYEEGMIPKRIFLLLG